MTGPMPRRTTLLVLLLAGALAVAGAALSKPKPGKPHKPARPHSHHTYAWHDVPIGSNVHLRGLAAVSKNKVWVSGYIPGSGPGKVYRTLDRGTTWQDVSPTGPATLQFRDIEAFDADHAVALSAGVGPDSRIYRTADGGQTWSLVFANEDPNAFYDCMTFFNRKVGLAL